LFQVELDGKQGMNEGAGNIALWILLPAFAAVGLYLVWYSRRRKQMLEAFARTHQFLLRPERIDELQADLDRCFTLKDEALLRSFGQLSTPVDAERIWIFRAVELLDLNPHAQSSSTHFSRIIVLFDVAASYNEFFVLDKSGQAQQRLSGRPVPSADVIEIAKRIVTQCAVRHAISVTLSDGRGLIYLEPSITGGETLEDVSSLYCAAKGMAEALAGK
jgi:hypothetical protein